MNRNRQWISRGLRPLLGTVAVLLLGLGLPAAPGIAQAASTPTAAAQTVYNYWAAIERHDYPAAYAQFAMAYRQDHSYEQFALTQWSNVQQAGNVRIVRADSSAEHLYMTAQGHLIPGLTSPYPAATNTFAYSLA